MIKTIKAEVTKEMIEAAKRIKIPMSMCVDSDHYWDVFLTEVLESAPAAESSLLNTCLSNAKQEPAQAVPYGWHVTGLSCLMVGEYAETDAKAAAKRCGGTTKAIPLYTAPPAIVEAVPVGVIDQSDDGYFLDFDWSSSAAGSIKIGAKVYTVPPAIDDETRRMIVMLCESIIDADDLEVLADDVIDFDLPKQILEKLEAGK